MKNLFKIVCISLFFIFNTNAQTLTALQQQNARATGYAIVASRNPGKSFTVNVIKWDGVNDLEYNAIHQINYAWHPQAVIKGNYFDQPFDNNDFSSYSSVILSQSEFDTYKSTGKDWWIVCSLLPSFSNSGVSVLENGNVGIGTPTPSAILDVYSPVTAQGRYNSQKWSAGNPGYSLTLQTIWNNSGINQEFIQRYNEVDYTSLAFFQGKVGIGTTNPDEKLTVNGKIHAKEIKIDLAYPMTVPDYVFANDYKLKSLQEVEEFIKQNSHLPEIPSAKEIEKNGLMLAEMNMSLLKKIEELTLYSIEQNKSNLDLKQKVEKLEKENEGFKSLSERLFRLENQLK